MMYAKTRMLLSWIGSRIDGGDVLYAVGVGMIGTGAWWYEPSVGLISAGIGVIFPFIVQMVHRPATPSKE